MSKEVKINYNNTFATQHSRDYYRGASFHWSGEWMVGAHYLSDDYTIDYVVHGQVLLACAKSHLSTLDNEPKDFITDESGTVIGVVSTYWDFVLSGIVGKSPGIKIQDNYWYICKDTGVPEEQQVWENTGVKAKMELSDLTPEEIEILQRPGKEVVTEFINNTMTQSTGDDPEKIMSQKATTDALNTKASKSELSAAVENEVLRANEAYQPKGDYATNTKVDNLQDEVDDFEDAVDEAFNAVSEALDTLQDNIDDVADSIPTKVSDLENDSRYQTKTDLDNAINPIKDVIPTEATVGNKLADKNFVTVSIEAAKAAFKGVSASGLTEEQFLAWANSLTTDENDYVFWNTVDSNGNAILKRYVRSSSSWIYEYTLSNNSFSTSEWNAIQSGITSELVSKLTNIEAGAQVNILEGVQVSGIDLAITNKKVNVDLTPITNVIPTQASSSNQLADKNFVNSSIATSTATFQGTSAAGLTQAQFEAWLETLTTADDNDYVFWNTVDSAGNVVFKRYKYNGTAWVYEYDLNNSSFTSTEWAAIQSGVTAELVTKLVALPTNADLTAALNNKVDKVTGKRLSTEDYTTEEKNKLAGIANGAEVNVQSDWNVTDTNSDAFIKNKPQNLVQDADYVHTDNNYTTAEKNKLSGIATSAQVNVLEGVQVNGTDLTITNKKVNVTVPTKTSQLTNDDNVVKDASYVHTDNNYTSTEKSKLSGIEESAQVNKIEHITLGGTEQAITNKTVNLPAYPTTLPASDVSAWAKASTKPSYDFSEIGGSVANSQLPSSISIENVTASGELSGNAFKVIAEHIAKLTARVEVLEAGVGTVDTLSSTSVDSANGYYINGDKTVIIGSGAPTMVPAFAGQFYINTSGPALYYAVNNSATTDWKQA